MFTLLLSHYIITNDVIFDDSYSITSSQAESEFKLFDGLHAQALQPPVAPAFAKS